MSAAMLSRRRFLTGTAASLTALTPFSAVGQNVCHFGQPCAQAPCLPPPNFDMQKAQLLAGLRPHRDDTYRLEWEELGGKYLVHNYGHGGAGITMSLGCAEYVVSYVQDILREKGDQAKASGIAVLGAGVMGLTAAVALARRYSPSTRIDIYAKDFYLDTTSHVAGGQWAPSSVDWDEHDEQAVAKFKAVLFLSLMQFKQMLGPTYGVSQKINYTLYRRGGLETAHRFGLIDREDIERLPFGPMNCAGHAYKTLLIEPPIFLKRLHNDLVAKLGKDAFHKRKQPFASAPNSHTLSPDIAKLSQKIIVNCTGLGAGDLVRDRRVRPIKGHLVLLPRQPRLGYLFSGYECHDWVQYLFPRSDGVIVGGTYQEDQSNPKINVNIGKHIVATMKNLFDGRLAPPCDDQITKADALEG